MTFSNSYQSGEVVSARIEIVVRGDAEIKSLLKVLETLKD